MKLTTQNSKYDNIDWIEIVDNTIMLIHFFNGDLLAVYIADVIKIENEDVL